MSELKRCPFCGGKLGFRTWIAFDGESYSLKCSTKDCLFNISSFKNKKDLIKKANTRKPMERIVEEIKNCKGGIIYCTENMDERAKEFFGQGKLVPETKIIEIIKEIGL